MSFSSCARPSFASAFDGCWSAADVLPPQTLLVTDVERVAPILTPLLRLDSELQGGRLVRGGRCSAADDTAYRAQAASAPALQR